jgi:predicted membrane protein
MNAQATTINSNVLDYLNTTAIFGEVKKTIISKDFKGGKINNLFGETTLDFTHADLSGIAMLDISQAFGEINITVPMNWRVETDISQFFASTEDKRQDVTLIKNSDKILVLTGTSAFAAINIISSI